MLRKKQEETQPLTNTKPRKRAAKPAGKRGSVELATVEKQHNNLKKAAKKVKADKPTAPAKSSKKTKPASTKRASHPAVDEAVVMAVFQGGKSLSKKELVDSCGGDEVAVTKTLKILRGEGKIAVKGSTRDAVYSLAA
jgi:hypothetical protein